MKEETIKILEKLDNTKEIKKIKELSIKLNNNEKYISLMKQFNDNKDTYIKNDTYNEELILLRKQLFSIEELNEYLKNKDSINPHLVNPIYIIFVTYLYLPISFIILIDSFFINEY